MSGTVLAVTHLRVQVSLGIDSGIPEDRPVNTFHFSGDATVGVYGDIADALGDFYESLRSRMPSYINATGGRIKMYNMSDPEPRVPVFDEAMVLAGGGTGSSLPAEVALCLSFQALRISGTDQSHRRGRIFWGPLNTSQVDTAGRPSTSTVTALKNAGQVLWGASEASSTFKWCVFSPTITTLANVHDGWVDNAFDTQRRRGLVPTARETFG